MKKKLLSFLCALVLLLSAVPRAKAFSLDFSDLIRSSDYKRYVQMMLDYYLRNDETVRDTLQKGYSAVFLFEGCSDNMDDAELSDLSYYRVSAVCAALRLDETGEPYICYYNENCSTLPDRPLDYGSWYFPDVGSVGPATVCDGTYELYSVYHGGAYEALHIRTSYEDTTIPAVYMTPEGYTVQRATEINIHTRTGNHILTRDMWSAGCILIGSGSFGEFTELIESTYYRDYDYFVVDRKVGCVTINRQCLKQQLYELYGDIDAVDMLLAQSRQAMPEQYLRQCSEAEAYDSPVMLQAARETSLMSLPCSNGTDARSVLLETIPAGEALEITGSIRNSMGNLWYALNFEGDDGYIYSEDTEEMGWFAKLKHKLFG